MMNFDFGANLRALRNGKGLTQEQAAELLNVSKQSVSRWETGITWPDIAFLPQLASFYGVSVDSLLGADEPVRQAILEKYREAHRAAHHRGDIAAAYELSRALYGRFPNDHEAMSDRMNDAFLMGRAAEGPKGREYLNEALAVAERFSRMTEDMEERCRCIRVCALCCKHLGQPEKAREWMARLPSLWSGIGLCALEVLEGEELEEHIRCFLSDLTDVLQKLIFAAAEAPDRSAEERSVILLKLPRLLELLFEEEDYGLFWPCLARAYTDLAEAAEDEPARREHADKALAAAEAFDGLEEGTYRSLLFRGLAYSPMEFTKTERLSQRELVAQMLAEAGVLPME